MGFLDFLGPIGSALGGAGGFASGIAGLFGGGRSGPDVGAMQQFSMQQLQMQMQFQREMAQNSIQYRVQDARNAGISPLVALGAPTYSPSLSIGGVDYGAAGGRGPDIGGSLARMGSGLGDVGKALTQKDMADAMAKQQVIDNANKQRLTDADVALKGAQAAYWSKKATEATFPPVAPARGGLAGQQIDRGFGAAREEVPKLEMQNPNDLGQAAGAGPNSLWKQVDEYTVVRVPRDPVIASASPWNPEYLKWQWGTSRSGPPPMEALPPGTVRWVPDGLNQWKASPYWPWESASRSRGHWLPQ